MAAGIEFAGYVVNQLGSPALNSNTFANRPSPGFTGRIFISTDTREIYRDTGTAWELIGSGGGSVNIYNSDGTLTGNRIVNLNNRTLFFTDNVNGNVALTVRNAATNSTALSRFDVLNDQSNVMTLGKNSSIFAGYKINGPSDGIIYNGTNGNISILNDNTSGIIRFAAGASSTAQMTLTNLGRLLLGTTTDAGFLADFQGGSSRFIRTTVSNSGVQILSSAGGVGGLSINGTTPVSNEFTVSANFNIYQSNQIAGSQTAIRLSSAVINTTSGNAGVTGINGLMQSNSGNANIWNNLINSNYQFSGSFSGTVYGYWYSPIITSLANGTHIAIQTDSGKVENYDRADLTSSNFTDRNIWTLQARLRQTLTAGADQAGAGYYTGGLFIRELSLSGNNTFGNATINAGGASSLQIDFTSAGTLTASQSGLRAFAGHQIFNTFGGSASGTITHFAGLQILGLYNRNSGVITPTITNAYGLVINNLNDYSHTFTLTNRWGIYQTGSSDNNYLAGKLLVGTTTVTARQVHINGNIELTTTLAATAGGSSGQHLSIWANGTEYKIALLNP